MLHPSPHATSRKRSTLQAACSVFVATTAVFAVALPAQAEEVPATDLVSVEAPAAEQAVAQTTATPEASAAEQTLAVAAAATPGAGDVVADDDEVPDPGSPDEAVRTLVPRVIGPGGMTVLSFEDAPAGATHVELRLTGVGAWRSTALVACASWARCDRDPVVVAQKGEESTGTQVVPLGGSRRTRVTVHNERASVLVTPELVRFVMAGDELPAADPAPQPEPAPEPAPAPAPAPKPAPAPAPKPAPAPAPQPSGGKPGAANTGVPSGTDLTVHHGDLTITEAGTVVDGLDIRGFVRVKAPNVVIKNSIIRGKAISGDMALIQASSTNLLVQDSELNPTIRTPRINGILGKSFTLRRVDIHHVIDQVHITGSNVRVEASWLHDNLHYDVDPFHSDGSHDDSIQIQGGSGIAIVGNTIEDAHNAAVMITQDLARVSNVTLADNWIDGGACTVNIAEKGRGALQGIVVAENVFGRDTRHRNCAVLAPVTTRISMDDNVYTDGRLVSVTKG